MTTSAFQRFGPDLQAEIERAVANPVRLLHEMLSHQIRGVPASAGQAPHVQRPHGALCLLVCEALSGDHHAALPAAVAVELAHQQFVVHGDVVETGNRMAGDHSGIQGLWGSGQAINAGDGLHALARIALTRLGEQGCDEETVLAALRILDDACAKTCDGLHRELVSKGNVQNVEQLVEIAALKTGPLMGCAAQLGALVAGKGDDIQRLCQRAGSNLGVALQLREAIASSQAGDAIGPMHRTALQQAARHNAGQALELIAQLHVPPAALAEFERLALDVPVDRIPGAHATAWTPGDAEDRHG